jgi:hypothetical protein
MQLASSFRYGSPMLRSDFAPVGRPDPPRRPVHLCRWQAPKPFGALHLHPDHRRAARSAQRRLPALHGLPDPRARSGQARAHETSCSACAPRPRFTGEDVNEIILLNSHDGSSSFQLLAGAFRFVCHNGMVAGDTVRDIRVHHKGNVVQNVINGAFDVLDGFDLIREQKDGMRALTLNRDEQHAFARSALALRYDPTDAEAPPRSPKASCSPRVASRIAATTSGRFLTKCKST